MKCIDHTIDEAKIYIHIFVQLKNSLKWNTCKMSIYRWFFFSSMNLQAFRLLGIILVELERAGDALNAFLTALDLDPERADEMTTYIASVSTFFCEIPQDILKKIKGNINKL